MAQARRSDDNTVLAAFAAVLAGTKAAASPGRLQEAVMSDRREHPQSGPGTDRHRWFVAIVVALVAGYVTARLL